MQKYFITKCNNYIPKNSLQQKGVEALRWLDKILVADLPKLRNEIEADINLLNQSNTRCKPLLFEFRPPKDGRAGYCGISELYTFYIYPIAKDFTEKEMSNG